MPNKLINNSLDLNSQDFSDLLEKTCELVIEQYENMDERHSHIYHMMHPKYELGLMKRYQKKACW